MSMTMRSLTPLLLLLLAPILATLNVADEASPENPAVGTSPWGPDDELGALNRMTDESRAAVLSRVAGGDVLGPSAQRKRDWPKGCR